MAAVFTETSRIDLGSGNLLITGTLAMDSSYPTNGEALDLSGYFPGGSLWLFSADLVSSAGYLLAHDGGTPADGKIEVYYMDYDAVADGVPVEIPNATDLSAITAAKVVMIGH
jgi:hypothetical protein